MEITVYLSGEIHTDWRAQIEAGVNENNLPIRFISAVTDHEASDAAGDILGEVPSAYWRDHQSAKINRIRSKIFIEESDLVIIHFGDQYKQWNAAFDAGYCAALEKPYITLHDENIVHPLKEVDATAMAWAKTAAQVVELLKYVTKQ